MKVIISRTYEEKQTRGYLFVIEDDQVLFNCVTIELPDLDNARKVSCIPEGKYEVHKITSPTKGKCFHLQNVPDRTAILIHIGNYATGRKVDTEGCILPGMRFTDINKDGYMDVAESTIALNALLKLLPNSFMLSII